MLEKKPVNKRYALFIFALGLPGLFYSQTFTYGIGMGSMIQTHSASPHISSFTTTNSFRYIVKENDISSYSIDLPVTFGFSSYSIGRGPDPTLGILIDAPLLLTYNYGAGNKRESNRRFGYFTGAGFGYHINEYSYPDENNIYIRSQVNAVGPTIHTGIRFATGRRLQHNLELRFSYMKMIDSHYSNIFGIGCLFNF